MTNEPEEKAGKPSQDADSDAEEDRPTVAPPFDPVAFAKEVRGGKPSPAAGTPVVKPARARAAGAQGASRGAISGKTPRDVARPPMPTLTDPAELEDARRRSLGSSPPSPPLKAGRATPQGLLSLANARPPSNLPPRANEAGRGFAPGGDRTWEELVTAPPPAMQGRPIDMHGGNDSPSMRDDVDDAYAGATAAPPVPSTAQEMNDRVSLGDYTGALEIAERLLAIEPDDEAVNVCAERCRGVLRQMYIARIGPLERVPVVSVARDQLRWLSIDHRAGFVLSLIDGVSSLEMILDVSGMPELDALRILSELAQQRIISFR